MDTQYTECLHIDLAKDTFNATNGKDEFSQMTLWLECKEQPSTGTTVPYTHASSSCSSAKAKDDKASLKSFQHPEFTQSQIWRESHRLPMICQTVSVYHHIKFVSGDPFAFNNTELVIDSIHVQPACVGKYSIRIPEHFDTVKALGVEAQVCCVFSLPPHVVQEWFKGNPPLQHFAYVEWFTPFLIAQLDPSSSQYEGRPALSIIPINLIKASAHLFPNFGKKAPEDWKSSSVLNDSRTFYVNPFNDHFQYPTIV
ncbi:hypothetical protein BDQ17DRAFT_1330295 [Cyathus striatus]|nr:hypothetical protein BDQ17DRAFT_1330295 [Cyathus striatus]